MKCQPHCEALLAQQEATPLNKQNTYDRDKNNLQEHSFPHPPPLPKNGGDVPFLSDAVDTTSSPLLSSEARENSLHREGIEEVSIQIPSIIEPRPPAKVAPKLSKCQSSPNIFDETVSTSSDTKSAGMPSNVLSSSLPSDSDLLQHTSLNNIASQLLDCQRMLQVIRNHLVSAISVIEFYFRFLS